MNTLPYVSSEGGPLLVGDGPALRDRGGSFGSGADYDRACEVVSAGRIGSLNGRILVWDIGGAGTAFLMHYNERSFQMVRFWVNDTPDDDGIRSMIELTRSTGERSSVHIISAPAIVVWACEETRGTSLCANYIPGIPSGDWSMGGTVYCFPVTPGIYSAEIGYFDSEDRSVISLTCMLCNSSEPGAAPNGDPALPSANAGVTKRPLPVR